MGAYDSIASETKVSKPDYGKLATTYKLGSL